jgi:hypothetical protein
MRRGPPIFPSECCAADLPKYNPQVKFIDCPFTGERLAAVPAIRPDVAVVHAQQADREGNVLLWGIVGVQKEVVMAARRSIENGRADRRQLEPRANSVVLPGWVVGLYVRFRAAHFRRTRLVTMRGTIHFISNGRDRARAPGLYRLDGAQRARGGGLLGVAAENRSGDRPGGRQATSSGQWLNRITPPTR